MQIVKKTYIDLPGVGRVYNMPGAKFQPKGTKREPVESDVGIAGYQEAHVQGELTMEIAYTPKVDLIELGKLTNINIPVELDNGHLYMMTGAWIVDPPEVTDGKVSLTFNCKDTNRVN